MTKICVECGAEFEPQRIRARYCSKRCRDHSRWAKSQEEIRLENEKLEERLILLNKKGLRDKEIAEQIGRSVSWVQKTRIKLGVPRQQAQQRIIFKEQEEFRNCKCCNSIFIPKIRSQIYCSVVCQKREDRKKKRDYDRKRTLKAQRIDYIPLHGLYERDNGICYLCGEKCDFNAVKIINGVPYALGDYPSRDHIKPLSKGGLHSWDNVRLAHIRCNSSKGAKYG